MSFEIAQVLDMRVQLCTKLPSILDYSFEIDSDSLCLLREQEWVLHEQAYIEIYTYIWIGVTEKQEGKERKRQPFLRLVLVKDSHQIINSPFSTTPSTWLDQSHLPHKSCQISLPPFLSLSSVTCTSSSPSTFFFLERKIITQRQIKFHTHGKSPVPVDL